MNPAELAAHTFVNRMAHSGKGEELTYLLFLPEGYGKGDRAWPLVLFLHGAGDNLAHLEQEGLPELIKQKASNYPFLMVTPQSPARGWDPNALMALVDDVAARHKVDEDRLYVTGFSMGGSSTWAFAVAFPERVAAIVPICGVGKLPDAEKLKGLPIWVFHGAQDPMIPATCSEAMVKALKDSGARKVKFTLYPEASHDAWTKTYQNPEVWEWLLTQKRAHGRTKE